MPSSRRPRARSRPPDAERQSKSIGSIASCRRPTPSRVGTRGHLLAGSMSFDSSRLDSQPRLKEGPCGRPPSWACPASARAGLCTSSLPRPIARALSSAAEHCHMVTGSRGGRWSKSSIPRLASPAPMTRTRRGGRSPLPLTVPTTQTWSSDGLAVCSASTTSRHLPGGGVGRPRPARAPWFR